MADEKDKKSRREYSVDEILAEYGSGRSKGTKVLDFPERKDKSARGASDESTRRFTPVETGKPPAKKPAENKPIAKIEPDSVGRKLGARLHTLLRRADHYADHMYDQAEPDEESRRAERYTPGVDREKAPGETRPRFPWLRLARQRELPPDTSPGRLAADYAKGLKGQGVRVRVTLLLGLIAAFGSLELSFVPWTMLEEPAAGIGLTVFQCRALILTALLLLMGALCYEIPAAGVKQLFTLKPRAESILLFAWIFTLLDGLTAGLWELRGDCLPCSAVTALGLAFALRGVNCRRRGDRLAAKSAGQVRSPYVVARDARRWSNKPAYTKDSGSSVGFGSRIQMEDGGQRAYRVAAPLLLLGCLLCAMLASVGQRAPERFLWSASACFTASGAWPALLAFGLPYRKLSQRLSRAGAALFGWEGAAKCGQGGVIVTDGDLFPTGSVTVAQVKVFGSAATEKVVGYTASMLRAMDCGLTRTFHDLLRAQGALYRDVAGLEWHEGGASGVIRGREVLVGTSAYMHLMDVTLPPGYNIKNAVFCAISGQLAGMFLLNYAMSDTVNPSLSALMKAGLFPVLATRDPNLIPALLEQKFKLPVDKLEFPPVDRRLELSGREPEEEGEPVALLSREGLGVYCDALVGGRRLRQAVRWGLIFALAGSAVGLCLTFYLTSIGAYASLTATNFLIFMAAWLVPEVLIANWVNQF